MDDSLRNELQQNLLELRDAFKRALDTNNVSSLSGLQGEKKFQRCRSCQFYNTCYNKGLENQDAIRLGARISPLEAYSRGASG